MAEGSLSLPVDAIKIGERARKELGDLKPLAESIAEIGLLHPVVVRPDGMLVSGARRLAACRNVLGLAEVPVTIIDIQALARGERDENVCRKDFIPSESLAIGRAVEEEERRLAKERQREAGERGKEGGRGKAKPSAQVTPRVSPSTDRAGRSDEKAASAAGMSAGTYRKAKAVAEAAEKEPEKFGDLAAKMDKTGKVDGAFKDLQRRQREEAELKAVEGADQSAFDVRQGDVEDLAWIDPASVDVVITDPPYPSEFLPVYSALAKTAARILKPGGSCFVMIGQSYLPEIVDRLAEHLNYQWCLAYLTPGGQAVQLWDRKVNTFWKPVLWLVNGEYDGRWLGDVRKSDPNDNDKRFHHWGQSESGMADIIRNVSEPGDLICDPFLGGGTTAVVTLDLGRRFVGADVDQACIDRTLARLGVRADAAA